MVILTNFFYQEGENATFINWGNIRIKKVNKQNGKVVSVEADQNLDDKVNSSGHMSNFCPCIEMIRYLLSCQKNGSVSDIYSHPLLEIHE